LKVGPVRYSVRVRDLSAGLVKIGFAVAVKVKELVDASVPAADGVIEIRQVAPASPLLPRRGDL
jgi:hypothetical protein